MITFYEISFITLTHLRTYRNIIVLFEQKNPKKLPNISTDKFRKSNKIEIEYRDVLFFYVNCTCYVFIHCNINLFLTFVWWIISYFEYFATNVGIYSLSGQEVVKDGICVCKLMCLFINKNYFNNKTRK